MLSRWLQPLLGAAIKHHKCKPSRTHARAASRSAVRQKRMTGHSLNFGTSTRVRRHRCRSRPASTSPKHHHTIVRAQMCIRAGSPSMPSRLPPSVSVSRRNQRRRGLLSRARVLPSRRRSNLATSARRQVPQSRKSRIRTLLHLGNSTATLSSFRWRLRRQWRSK